MWSEAQFIGGHPALDFINTVGDTGKTRDDCLLVDPAALAAWLVLADTRQAGLSLTPGTLAAIRSFREVAYQALLSVCNGAPSRGPAVQALEPYLKDAITRARLDVRQGGATWRTDPRSEHAAPDYFVLMVEALLRAPELARLRQCEGCTWLFLNAGRGRGRRWCRMATCGNRSKVAAHRARAT